MRKVTHGEALANARLECSQQPVYISVEFSFNNKIMPSLPVIWCLSAVTRALHGIRSAVGLNESNDPLTDGIEVACDIVFVRRVPKVLPVSILSVRVVLKSNHKEKH